MKQLAPGVYDDEEGGLHLDMAEFLAANGYVDTPENRVTLLEAVEKTFGDVQVTDDPIERQKR